MNTKVDGPLIYAGTGDGRSEERAVKQFQKLALKLRKTSTLILDVRGNKNGSFAFIEKWLKLFTRNHWKNVIVQERQTLPILKGLLNRVQWNLHQSSIRLLIGQDQLEQKRQQLEALIEHLREKGIAEKWVETKFIFNGNKNYSKVEYTPDCADQPALRKRLSISSGANKTDSAGCSDWGKYRSISQKHVRPNFPVEAFTNHAFIQSSSAPQSSG